MLSRTGTISRQNNASQKYPKYKNKIFEKIKVSEKLFREKIK